MRLCNVLQKNVQFSGGPSDMYPIRGWSMAGQQLKNLLIVLKIWVGSLTSIRFETGACVLVRGMSNLFILLISVEICEASLMYSLPKIVHFQWSFLHFFRFEKSRSQNRVSHVFCHQKFRSKGSLTSILSWNGRFYWARLLRSWYSCKQSFQSQIFDQNRILQPRAKGK